MTDEVSKKVNEILKAYWNGEYIQYKTQDPNDPFVSIWTTVTSFEQLLNLKNEPYNYRIKPGPKYVPFESSEEFIVALQKHGGFLRRPSFPLYYFPLTISDEGIALKEYLHFREISYEELYDKKWEFTDGTVCGKIK